VDAGGIAVTLLGESLPRRLLVPILLLGVTLRGIGGTLYIVCSYPFLMTCKPENRDRVFSFRFAIEIVGALIGNLIAGVLPATASWILHVGIETSTAYRASMLMTVPAMLCAYYFLQRIGQARPRKPDPEPPEQTPVSASPLLVIVLFAVFTVLFTMGRQAVRTFYNVYLDRQFSLPPHVIGSVMGGARLLGIPVAALSAVLNRRYGPWRVYLIGQIAFVLTILALALVDSPLLAVAAYTLFSAAVAITSPARDLYSQSVVAPRHRSLMSGAFNMAYGLGGSAIVYAGGFLISSAGFGLLFSTAAAIMACGALLLAFALPRTGAQRDAS
jgi:MFS family permease